MAGAGQVHDVVRPDPLTTLHRALAQQREGHLASAELLYEQAREALPGHFDAIHMLGVVKLQLGKFEEATRLLVAGLPLAPNNAIPHLKHNLALCLLGIARQRGVIDTMTLDPRTLERPTPFVRPYAIPASAGTAPGRISIILIGDYSISGLQSTLSGVRAQNREDLEVIAVAARTTPGREALQAALRDCGATTRLIVSDGAENLIAQVNIGAEASRGDCLCFLRVGDHWAPKWLQHMTDAMNFHGSLWGYGGLRAIAEDGTIVRFGSYPAVDALLREQDGLYVHRTASLGFLSFNPVAAGRNLIVRSDLWRQRGGLAADAADPVLEWAWRTAWYSEPVYVDDPGYLIPPATAGLHLHAEFSKMIASTTTHAYAENGGLDCGDARNPLLQHGLSKFWARQWQQIRACLASTMPAEVLLACAAMLGFAPADPTISNFPDVLHE
jgi:hypothetical protein